MKKILLKVNGIENQILIKMKEKNFPQKDIYDFSLTATYDESTKELKTTLIYCDYYNYYVEELNDFLKRGQEHKKEYKYLAKNKKNAKLKLENMIEKWSGLKKIFSNKTFICEYIIYLLLNNEREIFHLNFLKSQIDLEEDEYLRYLNILQQSKFIYYSKKQWIILTREGSKRFEEKYPLFISVKKQQEKEEEDKRKREQERKKQEQERKKNIYNNIFGDMFNTQLTSLTELLTSLAELELTMQTFNQKTLKENYRKLSKIYHPDNQETGNQEKFLKIKMAYEYLKNYR